MPPPEPVDSIFGALKPVERPKRSATTVANGYTVEEPTISILSRLAACAVVDAEMSRLVAIAVAVVSLHELQFYLTGGWQVTKRVSASPHGLRAILCLEYDTGMTAIPRYG